MIKAIVVIRTSTVRQEIEAQKMEITAYAKSFGYTDDELIVVGERGASARQLDEIYLKNLAFIYKTIEDLGTIEAIFAWQLDRIARDEVVFMEFKNFLIDHKVNMIIKNPSLFLLNPDGTVNNGMEIAINLFCTMAKQEMNVKSDRFMRAKRYISAQGKFIGARYMMYGYTTDSNGYLVVNEEEAEVIRLVYNLYCSEKYSARKIAVELNSRGYRIRKLKFNEGHITNMLKNTAYIGKLERNTLVTKFPVIIEEEQFNKVASIRHSRNRNIDRSYVHNLNLSLNVLKCWECGGNYMYVEAGTKEKRDYKYVCYNRQKKYRLQAKDVCTNSCAIQQRVLDEVLQDLAYELKAKYDEALDKTKIKEMEDRLIVLEKKIDTTNTELGNVKGKFAKVVDAWTDEIINRSQYEDRINKLKAEQNNMNVQLTQLQNEYNSITELLSRKGKTLNVDEFMAKLVKQQIDNVEETDRTVIKSTIDKFIKRAYGKAIVVNGTNLTVLMLADFNNKIYNYIFHQKHGKREGLYNFRTNKLLPYSHLLLFAFDKNKKVKLDRTNTGISTAIQNIIDSSEAMEELRSKVADLNKQMLEKIQ